MRIFVLGLEHFNRRILETLPDGEGLEFIELLSADDAVEVPHGFKFNDLVQKANEQIKSHGPADAILNYWDFPGSCLGPLLCRTHGLPSADLQALTVFEHKYWARRVMAEVIPEATPGFCAVDPFNCAVEKAIDLPYPFWIKPIISHSSYLGFKVSGTEDLDHAISAIRDKIGHFGRPFDEYLANISLPSGVKEVGGCHCIAEEIIAYDRLATIEGYVFNGQAHPLGCIDSIRAGQSGSSMSEYRYPSELPQEVIDRAQRYTAAVLRNVGYDNASYNVEFFWDPKSDNVKILEINTRISKSHCPLFLLVDGVSHHKVALDLALGRAPRFPSRDGAWAHASKFMVRLFQDGEITRVPTEEELQAIKEDYEDAWVQILVSEGQRLSHMAFQDSYSFEVADVFVGGRCGEEARHKYAELMERLHLEVDLIAPVPSA